MNKQKSPFQIYSEYYKQQESKRARHGAASVAVLVFLGLVIGLALLGAYRNTKTANEASGAYCHDVLARAVCGR